MTVAIVLSILCLCRLSFADALNPYTTLETKPTLVGIQLDGVIEEEWSGAARFDNFAEFMPTHQIAARVRTEGYVTHDDTDLFLAFVCYDPDIDPLRASLTDRDQIYRDDFVGIIIDTYRDQQRAYEFFSNAHGIQGDMLWNASRSERDDESAIWQANGGDDESFDAVWESEGRIYEDRWVVEMKIPLSCLRYPNRAQQNWGSISSAFTHAKIATSSPGCRYRRTITPSWHRPAAWRSTLVNPRWRAGPWKLSPSYPVRGPMNWPTTARVTASGEIRMVAASTPPSVSGSRPSTDSPPTTS